MNRSVLLCLVLALVALVACNSNDGKGGSGSSRDLCQPDLGFSYGHNTYASNHSDAGNSDFIPCDGPASYAFDYHVLQGHVHAQPNTYSPDGQVTYSTTTADGDGCSVHAIRVATGDILWQRCGDFTAAIIASTVEVDQDGILYLTDDATVYALNPLLANLFLHYAVDAWMERTCPPIPFERYADDIICHCRTELQAQWLRKQLEQRLIECGLQLHPEKTRIVYCKRDGRPGTYPTQEFDFLGFTFRLRRAQAPKSGKFFVGFLPAASQEAANSMRQTVRTWRLQYRTRQTLEQLAQWINPVTRGWVHYYGVYYRSALGPIFDYLDRRIARWARCKYKRLRSNQRRARKWLQGIRRRQPGLFVHWCLQRSMAGR